MNTPQHLSLKSDKLVFNWGHGIVLTFVLFAIFIGTMVYQMVSQRIELAPGYEQKVQVTK